MNSIYKKTIVSISKHLQNFFKKPSYQILIITCVFFILSSLVPNNKLLFIAALGFVGIIFLLTKDFVSTFLYSFLPMSLINVGQTYIQVVIPFHELDHPLYPEGQRLFFVYSPFVALKIAIILSFLLLCFFLFKKVKKIFSISALFFLLSFLFVFVAAIQSELFLHFSFLFTVSSFGVLCWGLLLSYKITYLQKEGLKELITSLFFQILTIIFFTSAIVFSQFLLRSTLGLTIEQTDVAPYFGTGADENPLQFRPIGLAVHANNLAMMLVEYLALFFILLTFLQKLKIKPIVNKNIILTAVFSLLVAVVFTQSRSAYLGLSLASLYLLFFVRNKIMFIFNTLAKIINKYKIFSFVFALLISLIVFDRAYHSIFSFSKSGGSEVRKLLIEESISLIAKKPIIGVGNGMYIPAAYLQNKEGVMSFFPEAVHNGFILFIAENGVVAFISVITAWFFLVKDSFDPRKKRPYRQFVVAYILSTSMIMLFQPFTSFFGLVPFLVIALNKYEATKK